MPLSARKQERTHNQTIALPIYQAGEAELPFDSLATNGVGVETAYEVLRAELLLDGQSRLNLATFVTTWMPALGARLMADTADTIRRFAKAVDVFALPRLPESMLDHPVMGALADLM